MEVKKSINLTNGWKIAVVDSKKMMKIPRSKKTWYDAHVPGVNFYELEKLGILPDIFTGLNEEKAHGFDNKDFIYKNIFTAGKNILKNRRVELIFEGIDTFSEIFLNNRRLGRTDNMFRKYVFDVSKCIRDKNTLVVYIHSPINVINSIRNRYPVNLKNAFSVYPPYARKAAFSFGWDWAPYAPVSGLWKPVRLEIDSLLKIRYYHIKHELDERMRQAYVGVETEIDSLNNADIRYIVEIYFEGELIKGVVNKEKITKGLNKIKGRIKIINPNIWWPNGYGKQHLYDVQIRVESKSGNILDRIVQKIGLRRVKVLQEPLEDGKSFTFEVNNQKIFSRGANWVPPDIYMPRMDYNAYEDLIKKAHLANMNMLRVWGGGVYENGCFYELCNKYGIMVWQDFMFSCGEYPEDNAFLKNVEIEAIQNVKRIRNYSCVVMWCGNNENHAAFYDKWDCFGNFDKFYGREIYENILKRVCDTYDGTRLYWPSSPYGGKNPNSSTEGDKHGSIPAHMPYEFCLRDRSRFLSEFPVGGFPSMRVIRKITREKKPHLQDYVIEKRNKAFFEGNVNLIKYVIADYRLSMKMEEFVYLSNLTQRQIVKFTVEHYRTIEFINSGILIWQFNDCWPTISWSMIDYYGYTKGGYWGAKQSFMPVIICAKRKLHHPYRQNIDIHNENKIFFYVVNDLFCVLRGKYEICLLNFYGRKLWEKVYNITVKANSCCEVDYQEFDFDSDDKRNSMLYIKFTSNDGRVNTDNIYFFEKPKYLNLPPPDIKYKIDDTKIKMFSSSFAHGVYLSNNISIDDNYFDLIPGIEKEIKIETKRPITDISFKYYKN